MTYRKLQSAHARELECSALSLTSLTTLTSATELTHNWKASPRRVPRRCKGYGQRLGLMPNAHRFAGFLSPLQNSMRGQAND